MRVTLWQYIGSLIVILLIGGLTHWIAYVRGFFLLAPAQPPEKKPTYTLSIILLCLAIFFGTTLILFPSIFALFTKIVNALKLQNTMERSLLANCAHSLALFIAIFVIFLLLASQNRKTLNKTLKDYTYENCQSLTFDTFLGILTWVIAFPLVIFASQLVELIVLVIFNDIGMPQNAIIYLRQMRDFPIALVFTIFSIVFLAPLSEELLFRGLIQTWLTTKMGRFKAICITSFIFSIIHFSIIHGLGNIPLLTSLFILSCYLGYLYERQRSLIAPIFLHATFNCVSVIRVLIGG